MRRDGTDLNAAVGRLYGANALPSGRARLRSAGNDGSAAPEPESSAQRRLRTRPNDCRRTLRRWGRQQLCAWRAREMREHRGGLFLRDVEARIRSRSRPASLNRAAGDHLLVRRVRASDR